jgi:hypothetical protein
MCCSSHVLCISFYRNRKSKDDLRDRRLFLSCGKERGLQGSKYQIFDLGVFTRIGPVRVGELGARQKNSKNYGWGSYTVFYFFSYVG